MDNLLWFRTSPQQNRAEYQITKHFVFFRKYWSADRGDGVFAVFAVLEDLVLYCNKLNLSHKQLYNLSSTQKLSKAALGQAINMPNDPQPLHICAKEINDGGNWRRFGGLQFRII
jgi:hypothetical protein